jgi:hypothetical protein
MRPIRSTTESWLLWSRKFNSHSGLEWKKPPFLAALSKFCRFGDMPKQRSHQNLQIEYSAEMSQDQPVTPDKNNQQAASQPSPEPAAPAPGTVLPTAPVPTAASVAAPTVFEYNDVQLDRLEKALSSDRLAPYFVQARGDRWVAIRLYERNARLSEALYGVVQPLEVILRNSIHRRLKDEVGTDDWYEKVSFLDAERDEIEDAKKAIQDRLKPLTPGRVVAELNFGFWVKLFSGVYEKELWVKHLRKNYAIMMQRTTVHERLVQIKTLRNRIAHHETLIRRDPQKDYRDTLQAIGWISTTVRQWVETTNCFEARFAERIPKKPKAETATPAQIGEAKAPGN